MRRVVSFLTISTRKTSMKEECPASSIRVIALSATVSLFVSRVTISLNESRHRTSKNLENGSMLPCLSLAMSFVRSP